MDLLLLLNGKAITGGCNSFQSRPVTISTVHAQAVTRYFMPIIYLISFFLILNALVAVETTELAEARRGDHAFRNKLTSYDSFATSPESNDAQHPEKVPLEVRTVLALSLHIPFSSTYVLILVRPVVAVAK